MAWLRADLLAGLTLWSVMVPEALAYAGIAGVPPIVGLYSVPIPLLVYALMGSSRTLVIGPDSATALVSSVIAGTVATSGSEEYQAVTSAIALVVGLLFLVLGFLRMGWVANFIPLPVMKGFIQGLVWLTILGQVPKLLGIEGGQGNFFDKCLAILVGLPQMHGVVAAIGIISLGLILGLKTWRPKWPWELITILVSILVVSLLHLDDQSIDLIDQMNPIATGLPTLQLPAVSLNQLNRILPGALAIVLLGYAESLGAAKTAAEKSGGEIDPNQELISHGPANLGTALSSGFVVVGSLSKTSIALEVGAKTQVSALIHSGLIVLTLMFLLPLFVHLPHATLAAIVIVAMLGLANFDYFLQLRKISPLDCIVAIVAFLGVLSLGVLAGILLGVILSLLILIYRSSHPGTSILGRIPGEQMYRSILRHPEAVTTPGLLIFRIESSLIFPNANYFRQSLKQAIQTTHPPIQQVLIDAESINFIDTTAVEMLRGLRRELQKKGIILAFARVRDSVRDLMRRAGLEREIGTVHFHERISDGVAAFKHPPSDLPDLPLRGG